MGQKVETGVLMHQTIVGSSRPSSSTLGAAGQSCVCTQQKQKGGGDIEKGQGGSGGLAMFGAAAPALANGRAVSDTMPLANSCRFYFVLVQGWPTTKRLDWAS
jgi:hypothetical protein